MQDYITSALATLLVIADPIFMSALFLGLTLDLNKTQRAEVALRGSLIAFFILLGAGLGGAKLLSLLGISLSAFRIGSQAGFCCYPPPLKWCLIAAASANKNSPPKPSR